MLNKGGGGNHHNNSKSANESDFRLNSQEEQNEPLEITPALIKTLKPKIEDYLNEKIEYLDCKDIFEANICFEIIKQLYNTKMKEYIKELSHISEKLRYYDQILAKKIGVQKYLEDGQMNLDD